MNKHISALFALIMGALLMTSCLNSDDSEVTYYNDTAITAFSLTTVNRYIHTTSKSGKDSVYKKTLSDPITFCIDHYNKTIYNIDSLYADCDLSHVITSISTKNSGIVVLKGIDNDTLYTYSSSDSLDFSKTREIRVYANDGSNYRAYQVTVNKHQVETEKLLWEQMPAGSYPVDEKKAQWEQIVANNKSLTRFIGAGTKEAYAYDQEGRLCVTKDGGETWAVDSLDESTALLPKESVAFVSCPFAANDQTDYQLLAGVIEEGEIVCSVWRKVAEYAEGSQPSKWAHIPYEVYNRYQLPAMIDFSLVWFHGRILAIDSNWIRSSIDGGITWKTSDALTLPASNLTGVEACTDDEGALWLKDKNTDNVWRGVLVEE